MKAILKCIHPLFLVGVALCALLLVTLPGQVGIQDIFAAGQGGPCAGIPVFLLFVPSDFMILLGLLLSAIRVFELRCERRSAKEKPQ
jgi:hypothetical protein